MMANHVTESSSRQTSAIDPPCWFCRDFAANHGSSATVDMHAGGFVGKSREYLVREECELSVPRCERCKSVHDRIEGYVGKGGLLGLLIGVVVALLYVYQSGFDAIAEKGTWKGALVILAVFGMIGGIAAWTLGRLAVPKGVKDQRAREQHPLIQQRIQPGWKIGPKPPGL
jgi:hypothetical protein